MGINVRALVQPQVHKKKPTGYDQNTPKDNVLHFLHTGKSIILPIDPSGVSDSMSASFASSTPLSRSAPIYSYSGSGPRTVGVSFQFHRELVQEYNVKGKEDYDACDDLIMSLEQAVLPDYNSASKMVNPPVVALKLRDEIYIKGVVTNVQKTFDLPILHINGKDKYAMVNLSFSISEITPQTASIVPKVGAYRS